MARPSDRERLTQVIQQWNIDHYDLFELSAPNQDLEFHGVVRFYFQGGNGANVITKCIRVSSTAATSDVIDTLIEKFRPDMRMLSLNKYALYEVHVNGEERRLGDQEKLLWVQLNWGKDVREGRFLLKDENEKTLRDPALGFKEPAKDENPNFKRKLSKREKKEKKKRDEELAKQNQSVSTKLYTEAPETSFTRSISNPEAVMRRRRQQKLEKKLAQMKSQEGGPDSGGTLKIYGESLQPDVPYKTLLLSTADTTTMVIKEAMEKYGLEKEDPEQFCLVEVLLPPGSQEYHGGGMGDERVMDEGECPLAINLQHPKHRGTMIFQLRRQSADYKRRNKRQRAVSHDDLRKAHDQPASQADRLPYLIELGPRDGRPQKHLLPLNITEVVRDKPLKPENHFLQLPAPDILPQHSILAHTQGIVTVTPTGREADVYVDDQRVVKTTMLRHGSTIQFGRHHFFKFVDPRIEEVTKPDQSVGSERNMLHQETNFDVDGHVETVTQHSPPLPAQHDRDVNQGRMTPGMSGKPHTAQSDQLPASLDFRLEAEDHLLQAVVQDVNSRNIQFKLAPTYVLYMAVRRLLLLPSQMNLQRSQHFQIVADFIRKTSKLIQRTIQERHNDPTTLAFWIANTSELLNLVKQDVQVQPFASDSQELLAEAVQMAFHHLVRCFQGDLQQVMPAFLDPSDAFDDENPPPDQYHHGQPMLADVLKTLSAAMTLLRRCRVNAALTIQLFSQLFHFINMWLFNILALEPQLQLCTRVWGLRLKRRLGRVEAWAEKQGLELAADCHLCRIIQAAHLLQAPKMTSEDINNITATCFKLNSMQVEALLTRYIPDVNEPPISPAFITRVVDIATDMTDELTRTEGGEVRLEEDPDLHLPFLLPEDGYSCDTLRGIPDGLPEFATQLSSAGLCHMVANSQASGSWMVHIGNQPSLDAPPSPDDDQSKIMTVTFQKLKGSMGLSIVAAVGDGEEERGIYIKSVVPGGAAAQDGRLKAGDQLLEVDGKNLVGLSQQMAAELMTQTGNTVTLKVAKERAMHHGLATLLNEPSPTLRRHATKVNPMGSGDEAPPPPYSDQPPANYSGMSPHSPNDASRSRPVPQPRGQNPPSRGGLDRRRSPSADNLSSQPRQGPPSQQPPPSNFHRREVDPRSKSTSNLHADASFDNDDSSEAMRAAKSVGMLHPGVAGPPGRYSPYQMNRGSPDVHQNNYENHSQRSPGAGQYNSSHPYHSGGVGPNSQHPPPARRPSDRASVSSRSSSNSGRDPRPQSAYYNAQPSPPDDTNQYGGRPKSVEVTHNKVKEWQEKYTPQSLNAANMRPSPNSNHKSPDQRVTQPDPRSKFTQPNPGYRAENKDGYRPEESSGYRTDKNSGYRTEKNAGYRAEDNVSQPPSQTNRNPAGPKSGVNFQGPPSNQNPSSNRPGQAPRGVASTNQGHYSNFKSVAQSKPQDAPRLSARERLFGKQGGSAAGSSGGVSKPAPPSNEQKPLNNPQSSQPLSQEMQDLPIKPDPKPKPAIKPKPPPIARKPQLKASSGDVKTSDSQQPQPGVLDRNGQTTPQSPQGPSQPSAFSSAYSRDQANPQNARAAPQDARPTTQQQDPRGQHNDYRPMQQGNRDPRSTQPDPRGIQQDPRGLEQETRGMNQDPRGMQQNPRGMQQDPRVMQQDPRGMQQDPRVMQQDPRGMQQDPGVMQQDPRGMQQDPRVMQQDPRGMQQDPRVMQQDPRGIQDPRGMQQDPRRMQQDPRGAQQDPRGMQQAPRGMQQDPIGMQHDPTRAQQDSRSVPQSHRVIQPNPRGPPADHKVGPSMPAVKPQGSPGYGYPPPHPDSMDDFPPHPEDSEDMLPLPPPPPMEDFYDEHQKMMDPIPPPPNLPSAYDQFGRPVPSRGQGPDSYSPHSPHSPLGLARQNTGHPRDPNNHGGNFPSQSHPDRMGHPERSGPLPPQSSSHHHAPHTQPRPHQGYGQDGWNREDGQRPERPQAQESRSREQDIMELESRSYLSIQDQERLRRLKQEQDFQQRMLEMEERSDFDADDDEVESFYGQEHEVGPGHGNEAGRPPGQGGPDDRYPSQSHPSHHFPPHSQHSAPPANNRQHNMAHRPQPPPSTPGSGRSNPMGPAFDHTRDADPSYEYMNYPPPHQQGKPPEERPPYDPAGVSGQDQGYHSLPYHSHHYPADPHHPDNLAANFKKSVSFNTELNTYQIRTPSHSYSSEHMSPPADISPSSASSEVFQMPPSHPYHPPPPTSPYAHPGGNPDVIGAQEVYRDPRSRIEAQRAAEQNRNELTEDMSFRDKMKYFRKEGGDGASSGYRPQPARPMYNTDR